MDERGIIDTLFKPLAAKGAPAFGLENDTAIYTPPPGYDLVITKDVMIEGVHFLDGEDGRGVARRLLRSNLSDLAAAGAKPVGYLLGLMGKETIEGKWLKAFAAALKKDQNKFGITLFGGDTTSGSKSLSLSLTALGTVKSGRASTRLGAKAGDLVFVSGTIGDATLGLECLKGNLPVNEHLIGRYQNPEPRLALGQNLVGLASAVIDISDGLVLDAENLCRASGVGARLDLGKVPLSAAAKTWAGGDQDKLTRLVTAGDDFELLFTVAPESREKIESISKKAGLPITLIGEIAENRTVEVIGRNGAAIPIKTPGYRHFRKGG